jgi:CheY-like chemotaxis protein
MDIKVLEFARPQNYRNIPIIVMSSLLEDQQLKNKFLAVGANAFITKAEFDRTNLLTEVKGFPNRELKLI